MRKASTERSPGLWLGSVAHQRGDSSQPPELWVSGVLLWRGRAVSAARCARAF